MVLLQRAVKVLLGVAGFVAGILVVTAAWMARLMINPPRQRMWATPANLGLDYEDVQFPAQDGVRLSGWFLPAMASSQRQGATLILMHGWLWNRLGDAAEDSFANLIGSSPVDLLRLAHYLHHEGYHVFMFDWRNHGQSAAKAPVTFGATEANDLLGALTYVNGRSDVDAEQVGVIAFSSGANALLYTLSQTPDIKAAIAVQPTTPHVFAEGFSRHMLGPMGSMTLTLSKLIYRLAGGPHFDGLQPKRAVSRGYPTPILYIQGEGDQWGSMADVDALATATVAAEEVLVVDTNHRFGGYQYLVDHPEVAVAFFDEHFRK